MFDFSSFILVASILVSLDIANFSQEKHLSSVNETQSSSLDMSANVAPEEEYSLAKAMGDVGVFPDNEYKGTGVKIGVLESGIPSDLTPF